MDRISDFNQNKAVFFILNSILSSSIHQICGAVKRTPLTTRKRMYACAVCVSLVGIDPRRLFRNKNSQYSQKNSSLRGSFYCRQVGSSLQCYCEGVSLNWIDSNPCYSKQIFALFLLFLFRNRSK